MDGEIFINVSKSFNLPMFSFPRILAEKGDYEPSEHDEDYIGGLQFMPNQVWCFCLSMYRYEYS